MVQVAGGKVLKSPDYKLLPFFHRGRDRWYPFTPTPPEVVLRSQGTCVTTGAWRDDSPNGKLPS